ncbi:hypothetical protein N7495_002966 [Penicillium taxi]|uniref:uncharacterized protein n=1 Tax=Penicillium taxi TaxID=168475 RepID=UPI0025452642|nr:uncharacterized protein N7495_002966 [Penicillium taxi]KAJ5902438.1 hypothetical protein N7495_002966 [Penicillium taxi]
MRWASQLLALVAAGALGTNALEASILTFPGEQGKNYIKQEVVSEDVARLILELRTKPSLASVLGKMDTDMVDRLNQFTETEFTLFGSGQDSKNAKKSVIIIEGLGTDISSVLRKREPQSLFVPRASSDLVSDYLESLMEEGSGKYCLYDGNFNGDSNAAQSVKECLSKDPVLSQAENLFEPSLLDLINSAETWLSKDGMTSASKLSLKTTSNSDLIVTESLMSTLNDLTKLSSDREITAILLPMLGDQAIIPPRPSRRDTKYWAQSSTTASGSQSDLQRSSALPLHSNLAPVCHSTNSSCTDATNNCSGHGSCFLKYGSSKEGSAGDCYACRCKPTIKRMSDGTIQKDFWGGPSCEKKDISSPFFLIASVSILAIVMVGSAIGMLFSMGQQELPSVIGAGVGGSKTT